MQAPGHPPRRSHREELEGAVKNLCGEVNKSLDDLRAARKWLRNDNAELIYERHELKDRRDRLEDEVEYHADKKRGLQDDVRALKREKAAVRAELAEVTSAKQELDKSVAEAMGRVERCRQEYMNEEERLKAIRARVQALEQEKKERLTEAKSLTLTV
jgi:chromosome segregation ATPase